VGKSLLCGYVAVGVDMDLDGVTAVDLQRWCDSFPFPFRGIVNGAVHVQVHVHVKVHDHDYVQVKVNGSSVESMV